MNTQTNKTLLNYAANWFKMYDIKTTLKKGSLFISLHNIEISKEEIRTRANLYLEEEIHKLNLITN
tara:strand:+ start:952 stop:1149 length:198 start_codon:yes stop_codon:yes gene_type:complete